MLALSGRRSETCHWRPTICGTGDVTFTQLSKARFVQDCNAKPAFDGGHDNVRFVPVSATPIAGLWVFNSWPVPSAVVAAISAAESPVL